MDIDDNEQLLTFERKKTQAEAWYKVLTYSNQKVPHADFLQTAFLQFAKNHKLRNYQFVAYPMISVKP